MIATSTAALSLPGARWAAQINVVGSTGITQSGNSVTTTPLSPVTGARVEDNVLLPYPATSPVMVRLQDSPGNTVNGAVAPSVGTVLP